MKGDSSFQEMDRLEEKWRGGLQGALDKLFIWLLEAVFMLLG